VKVHEVMTRDVITVRPETPIQEAARLMVTYGVSGLPVVDGRQAVVGILSEGDLILREKPRERAPWWRAFFDDGERLARDYQKAMGSTVGEVMTRAVLCVSPDLTTGEAAAILDSRRIRRLPVLRDGRLVGIVSRGDLIKALANATGSTAAPLPDAQLVREMKARMAREPWAAHAGIVVQASAGIVVLRGTVENEAQKAALETMARALPGSRGLPRPRAARLAPPAPARPRAGPPRPPPPGGGRGGGLPRPPRVG
jgi:CBS domain-containing protein